MKVKKVMATALALLVVGSGTLGIGRAVTGSWDIRDWSNGTNAGQVSPSAPDEDAGGVVIEESVGNGISVMSSVIPRAAYAENGISALAQSAYTLTATITPEGAENKAVDWTVSFVNPTSSWATGKTVSDYVTVTPTSDGALTANVECKQGFAEQIKVTVTSRDNAAATASCTVDYMKKVRSLASFSVGSSVYSYSGTSYRNTWDVADSSLFFQASFNYTDYTIDDEFELEFTFKPEKFLINLLEDNGLTPVFNAQSPESSIIANMGNLLVNLFPEGEEILTDPIKGVALRKVLSSLGSDEKIGEVRVAATGEYSFRKFVGCKVIASGSDFAVPVENITLDQGNLIF